MPQIIHNPNSAPIKPLIDQGLPSIVNGTLGTFVNTYYNEAHQASLETSLLGPHTKFALTGHFTNAQGQARRMRLMPAKVEPRLLDQVADVDSAIGFVFANDPFPLHIGHSMFYQMLNSTDYTLSKSLHLPPYTTRDQDGNIVESFQYHSVPNALLGHIGGANVARILVRIMFPKLRGMRCSHNSNHVEFHKLELFYDLAIRYAVEHAIPLESHEAWPGKYSHELLRAQRENGTLVYSTRTIPSECMDQFLRCLRQAISQHQDLAWAQDFWLQLQVQGTKYAAQHTPGPAEKPEEPCSAERDAFEMARINAVITAVYPINLDLVKEDFWFVDIATTIHSRDPANGFLPRDSKHGLLLSLVTGLPRYDASKQLVNAKHLYHVDESSHLGYASGFRLTLTNPPPSGACYIQVYTSDKHLTALKDGWSNAKHLKPRKVLDKFESADRYLDRIMSLYRDAMAEGEAGRRISVRIESRVHLARVMDSHHWLPEQELAQCITLTSNRMFWFFKMIRIQSVRAALQAIDRNRLAIVDDMSRALPTMTLIAGLCYMANALNNRPDDSTSYQILRDTLCIHKVQDDHTVAIRPLNVFFCHSLRLEPHPRCSSHRVLPGQSMYDIFHFKNRTSAQLDLQGVLTASRQSEAPLARGGNGGQDSEDNQQEERDDAEPKSKVSRAARMVVFVPEEAEDVITDDELRRLPQLRAAGPGQGYESEEEDPEPREVMETLGEMMNGIFKEIPISIMKKVSETGGKSWRKIDDNLCSQQTWRNCLCDATQLPELLVAFRQVSSQEQWEGVVKRIFPTQEEQAVLKSKGLQGWKQSPFWIRWEQLLAIPSWTKADRRKIVEFARRKMREEAQWLPLGAADRMWTDKGPRGLTIYGRAMAGKLGMVVVLNPKFANDMKKPGGH